MDGNEREFGADVSTGSGTAARMKKNLTDKAQDAKEGLTDLGRKTAGRIDGSRESTANALAWTATSLHSRTDKMSHLAHSAEKRTVRNPPVPGDCNRARAFSCVVETHPDHGIQRSCQLGHVSRFHWDGPERAPPELIRGGWAENLWR